MCLHSIYMKNIGLVVEGCDYGKSLRTKASFMKVFNVSLNSVCPLFVSNMDVNWEVQQVQHNRYLCFHVIYDTTKTPKIQPNKRPEGENRLLS